MITDNSTSAPRRNQKNSIVPGCPNQVYVRQLCCRHGAKKTCSVPGCDLRARTHGICFSHGAPKSRYDEPGCNHPAQARKKCVKHGGGRRCTAHGCTSHARYKGKCKHHAIYDTPVDMVALWGTPDDTNHELSYSDDSMDDAAASIPSPSQDDCGEINGEHAESPQGMMMEVCALLLSP
ncbi:hypothetical protein AC1031_021959 [Aphanomyces cochlioides]|nr:hypothetical protein AC1031_021959 [Aphanomyces cochlioides]